MRVVGADGCRGGWVLADRDGVEVVDRLDDIVADATVLVVGVDMPIGLPREWGREADREARRLLGRPGASSVFPTPPRSLLTATTYVTANQRSKSELGRGLTRQTYHLFERIREVDRLVTALAGAVPGDRLVEIHPECSFRVMAGAPLPSKHTADGIERRRALLLPHFGPVVHHRPGSRCRRRARRLRRPLVGRALRRGEHLTLGDGGVDELGLPMRIVT
jgi:predicted RNase H-like nuclease